MKKFLSLLLALVLMLSMSACGNKKDGNNATSGTEPETTASTQELQPSATPAEIPTDGVEAPPASEWKQFLADYNTCVEESIVAISNYMADPENKDLLPAYAYAMEDLTEMALQSEALLKTLETEMPDVVEEYKAELAKIKTRLADMSY